MPDSATDALDRILLQALAEDVGDGDITTRATVAPHITATATFIAKEKGILAGQAVVHRLLQLTDPTLIPRWDRTDGEKVVDSTPIGTICGNAHSILTTERLALNILQRMSGIATATGQMLQAMGNYHTRLRDTRKTAPGLRLLDKWAVRLGGGENHRMGLYDMILVKDNHVAAAGGIQAALKAASHYRSNFAQNVEIELEVRTLNEVTEALNIGGFDTLLLDNMVHISRDGTVDTTLLSAALTLINGTYPTEASGNVTLASAGAIAATGVDYISSGALTHSVQALDISLVIETT